MLLACAIHHLKDLIEETVVAKDPHCLFYKLSAQGISGDFPNFFAFCFFQPETLETYQTL